MPPEVKICGISTLAVMDAALDAGADLVGLVFYPASPRNVTLEQAEALAERARGKADIVALVVDAPDAMLAEIARVVSPDFFQAHGSETPARVAEIARVTKTPVIKAIKVRDAADVAAADAYAEAAALVLFDARAPGEKLPGGNGVAFDWSLLHGRESRFMLSGGLDPENVAEAVRTTGAAIVDVSSGVESAPGVKDVALVRKFIEAARGASQRSRP